MPSYHLPCLTLLAVAFTLAGCTQQPTFTPEEIQAKGGHIQFPSDFAPEAAAHCIERNAARINNNYVSTKRELDNGIELTMRVDGKDGDATATAQILPRADTGAGGGSTITISVTPRNASPRSLAMYLRGKC